MTASCDAIAVILPFERELWRRAGARAEFVGHPAVENLVEASPVSPSSEPRLLLLPGSRSQEVRLHWPLMLDAAKRLATPRVGVAVAPSHSRNDCEWMERVAAGRDIRFHPGPAVAALGEYDLALAASGTVTLECVAAGVPPVIVYRTDRLTYALARRLVRVPCIGLPNLVAGDRLFPELVQNDAQPVRMADALLRLWRDAERYRSACLDVRRKLSLPGEPPSARVARMLASWL